MKMVEYEFRLMGMQTENGLQVGARHNMDQLDAVISGIVGQVVRRNAIVNSRSTNCWMSMEC